jgi:hypothetical protein
MKLAVVMLCLIGVILAFSWGRLPLGNIASPTDVQGKIFDNVQRNFR